jgi:hypothetical protein
MAPILTAEPIVRRIAAQRAHVDGARRIRHPAGAGGGDRAGAQADGAIPTPRRTRHGTAWRAGCRVSRAG